MNFLHRLHTAMGKLLVISLLLQMVPVEAAKQKHSQKAPRPSLIENNLVCNNNLGCDTGCAPSCDLDPVLKLLTFIKHQVGAVRDSSCCNSVLGILGDACDILGKDESISSYLREIYITLNACCADIVTTVTECCADLNTTITTAFQTTWTQITDLTITLTHCCADLNATITNDFQGTWTILAAEALCMPTAITEPITITTPGSYCLAHDINGTIIVTATGVCLDLNCHTINALGGNGVTITGDNVLVKHGTISNASIGVYAAGATDTLELFGLNLVGCSGYPVLFTNISGFRIEGCNFNNNMDGILSIVSSADGVISNCIMNNNIASTTDLLFIEGDNIILRNLEVSNNTLSGGTSAQVINIFAAENIIVVDSTVNNNTGTVDAVMNFFEGGNHILKNCTLHNNSGNFGVSISAVIGMEVTQCSASNNVESSTTIQYNVGGHSAQIVFEGCSAFAGQNGYSLSQSNDCFVANCIAQGASSNGFLVTTTCNNCYFQKNVALGNASFGFTIESGTGLTVKSCTAEGNSTGFAVSGGATQAYFKDNISINNSGYGFSFTDSGPSAFTGSYADSNGTNYIGFLGIITYDKSAFMFFSTPNNWSNISAV